MPMVPPRVEGGDTKVARASCQVPVSIRAPSTSPQTSSIYFVGPYPKRPRYEPIPITPTTRNR
jgi:tartrate dehydratase beta subunit/fumarate hydratase class I family protein